MLNLAELPKIGDRVCHPSNSLTPHQQRLCRLWAYLEVLHGWRVRQRGRRADILSLMRPTATVLHICRRSYLFWLEIWLCTRPLLFCSPEEAILFLSFLAQRPHRSVVAMRWALADGPTRWVVEGRLAEIVAHGVLDFFSESIVKVRFSELKNRVTYSSNSSRLRSRALMEGSTTIDLEKGFG